MQTTIPFDGFYESIPDGVINDAITLLVSDSRGDAYDVDIWGEIDTTRAQQVVADMYAENFLLMLRDEVPGMSGLTMPKTVDVDSPREYNFATDRLFAEFAETDLRALLAAVDPAKLAELATERFTSRSGFISFYDPDVTSWGDLATWDHNQLGTLLEAAAAEFFTSEWRWACCEDMDSNGVVSEAVYEGLTDEGKRIVRVTDYLRAREERRWQAAA